MTTFGIELMPGTSPGHYTDVAIKLEDLGFTHIWVPDERFWQHVTVAMTQVAMVTKKVNIGTAVTDPYIRHPALTAQMIASLDEVSNGRVIMGFGAGVSGFKALGIKREKPVRAIREAVELIRNLWTGEVVNYNGEIFQFHGASLDFKPLRSRIPVYIAGRGPQVLTLAGNIADGVLIGSLASPEAFNYAIQCIKKGLQQSGRSISDIKVGIWLHTAISEDKEAAYDAVRTIVTGVLISSLDTLDEMGLDIPSDIKESLQGVTYGLNSPDMERARSLLSKDILRHFSMAGTPEECREHAKLLKQNGVDHIALVPWTIPGQTIENFAELAIKVLGDI